MLSIVKLMEMKKQADIIKRELDSTEIEVEEVIRNREIWLTHEEIGERLDIMFEAKANEPCDCGDEQCPKNLRLAQGEEDFEDIEEFDLEELIAQKVEEALAAAQKPEKKASKPKAIKVIEKVE